MRRSSRRKSPMRRSSRRKSPMSGSSRRKSPMRRSSRRKSPMSGSSRRKSPMRRSSRRKSFKFSLFGSNKKLPHYLCSTKDGSYRCNSYPNLKECKMDEQNKHRKAGVQCTSDKSKCLKRCGKVLEKTTKMKGIKYYAYKCDAINNRCKKYDSAEQCMNTLSSAEKGAGIRCFSKESDCKSQCDQISSKLKGMGSKVITKPDASDKTIKARAREQEDRPIRPFSGIMSSSVKPTIKPFLRSKKNMIKQEQVTPPKGYVSLGGGPDLYNLDESRQLLKSGKSVTTFVRNTTGLCKKLTLDQKGVDGYKKKGYRVFASPIHCKKVINK
jgi:hypothetical protein